MPATPAVAPSPADVGDLVRAYRDQHWSSTRCAEQFGCCPATVIRILRGQGVAIRRRGARRAGYDPAVVERAYRDQGWSLTRCAREFGMDAKTVTRLLRERGVPIRPRGPWRVLPDPAALERAYRDQQWPLARCAREFGIDRVTAARILRERGVIVRAAAARRTPPDPVALERAYLQAGWSLARCGREFGIDQRTVARMLRKRGVAIRARLAPPGE